MVLRLHEIQFNHDSSSLCHDAFNIRKNEQDSVDTPEWRRGVSTKPEDSPAAYARLETHGNTLTIKANFSFEGAGPQDVCIQALDANFHREPVSGTNLSIGEVKLLQDLIPNPLGNVIGEVKPKPITINTGETGLMFFDLQHVRIEDAGVGVQNIVWRWQYRFSGTNDWIDLAVTTHRIYTVLQVPKPPWSQDNPPSNTQLPWVEVLNYACTWACNAQNTDDAAAIITTRVNGLGPEVISYKAKGSTYYSDHLRFDCSSFLARLRGEVGQGKGVNCDDCAAIVTTFANIIGCDLAQMCIRPIVKSTFRVKPHVRIGILGTQINTEFFHHRVAVEGGCGTGVEVFDACLRIGNIDPSVFTLPTNLPYSMGTSGYFFRLVADEDQSTTQPHPNCKRLRLAAATGSPESCASSSILQEYFEFASWEKFLRPGPSVFVSEFFFADYISYPLHLAKSQESEPGIRPSSIKSLWTEGSSRAREVFRIDLYETASWHDAREGLMGILATLQGPGLVRQQIESVGDVTFADPAFEDVLFAVGNLVFYLRNVGSEIVPLIELGQRITEAILNSPPGVIEELDAPNFVKRFSFATGYTEVGRKTRILEESPFLLAPRRLYQFIAEAGEVLLDESGNLVYLPRSVGVHRLKIFAVDTQGNAVLQTLSLTVR